MPIDTSAVAQASEISPNGKYYTPNLPFLGACVAMACGTLDEREQAWEADARTAFWRDRYGLSVKHTVVMMLPEGNPLRNEVCFPTPAEIDVVIEELTKVLSNAAPASGPVGVTPPDFDADLRLAYPTLVELYLALQFGIGQAPPDWQWKLHTEFNAVPTAW